MSTNMYNDYDNEYFDYYTTSTFDNRIRTYLISRYEPTATWNYGDSITINFNIHEWLSDEEVNSLEDKYLIISFYNNRYELLPFNYQSQGASQISVAIDYRTSIKYFERGVYHCSVELVIFSDDEESESEIDSCETLLSMNECSFYVQ